MSKLKPNDIKEEVKQVLKGAPINDRGRGRSFQTAYQILLRLPEKLRNQLIEERGKRSGERKHYTAATVVAQAATMLGPAEVDTEFLDRYSLSIKLEGALDEEIEPGSQNVGLYRLRM